MHPTTTAGPDPESLLPETAKALLRQHWKPEMGAIDGHDLAFIAACIAKTDARQVVEVGCASGLSTGLIAYLLDARKGGRVDSFDAFERFTRDRTKPTGYIATGLTDLERTTVRVKAPATSLRLPSAFKPNSVDVVFIDASHKHPWPALDTLCALPVLKDNGIVIHHDIFMFRSLKNPGAIGPKMLHNLISERHLIDWADMVRPEAADGIPTRRFVGNIFGIRVDDTVRVASEAADSLYFPWTILNPLPAGKIQRIAEIIDAHFGPLVLGAFEASVKRYAT